MSPTSTRLHALDGLRGVAAVIVLVHHSLLTVPALAAPYYSIHVDGFAAILAYTPLHLLWAGTEAVYLFFVLSGLVLALSVGSPRFSWAAYFPSRLVRLYLPVIAAVAFAAVVFAVFPRDLGAESIWIERRPDTMTWAAALSDVTLLGGVSGTVSPLWSLQWEVLFSLLLPLYIYLARRTPAWVQLVAYAILSTAGVLGQNGALTFLPMFGIGVALAEVWDALGERIQAAGPRRRIGFAVSATTAAVLLTSSYWMLLPVLGASARAVTLVPTLAGVTIVIIAAAHVPAMTKILTMRPVLWLGAISFSLYLIHEPIVIAIGVLLERPAFTVLLAVPISIAAAALFHRLVERPAHSLSRRVRADAAERLVLVA